MKKNINKKNPKFRKKNSWMPYNLRPLKPKTLEEQLQNMNIDEEEDEEEDDPDYEPSRLGHDLSDDEEGDTDEGDDDEEEHLQEEQNDMEV